MRLDEGLFFSFLGLNFILRSLHLCLLLL